MEELSIRIRIADREYPMRVRREEEERIREAGRLVNEKLRSFSEQYGLQDHQDLLAMVAFDSMVRKLELENQNQGISQNISERINHLNTLLSQAMA